MRPRSFYLLGALITLAGFIAISIGVGIYYQIYSCTTSPSTCILSSSELGTLGLTMLTLFIFGFSLILVGAIWTAAGHISQHMPYSTPPSPTYRPTYPSLYPPPRAPTSQTPGSPTPVPPPPDAAAAPPQKICARCGRLVEPTAKFCSNCGTPWLSPVKP